MTNHLFYEVQDITKRETTLTARFRTLADALRYVKTHEATGTWDIVTPEGRRIGTPEGRRIGTPHTAAKAKTARRGALRADTVPAMRRAGQSAA